MIIQRIELENFRALKEVNLRCDNLLAILGRNGAGKSSVLYALDKFYDVAAQFNEFDYFDQKTDNEMSIRITYGELREDEKAEFSSYLTDNTLIVTKVINSGGAKYYAASWQLPDFIEIRKLGAVPKRTAFNQLVDSAKFPELIGHVSSGNAADEAMSNFELTHAALLQVTQKETQFFGPRSIGGGKLDKYTKFVLIPAVRDASSETERRGAILQLIDVLVMRSVNARPDVRALNEEFERRVREVYSAGNLTELHSLGMMITEVLRRFAPGAELDLSFGEVVPPKLNLPPAIASLVEDNFKCPISYSGHGLQRALIFALLQQLSLTDLSPASEAQSDIASGDVPPVPRMPDLILAIEEPELYLHPSRCRFLSSVMLQLSRPPSQPTEPRTQILYGTHSPFFVDLDRFDQIRLARKVASQNTATLQTNITSFSRAQAAQKLAEISLHTLGEFTETTFAAHAAPVMTTIVNEGFFADVVVVVEGLSEVAALWTVQDIQTNNWDALGIALVPASGKNNIDRPVVVFRGLSIPTYFIFDADSRHIGSDREAKSATSNHLLLRLAGVEPEDFPSTRASDSWAVFNDELETELKSALGDGEFNRVRQSVADELGYTQPSGVLKNPEGISEFIRAAYSSGCRIAILEDIVTRITALCNQR